jgi:hypothetical protein
VAERAGGSALGAHAVLPRDPVGRALDRGGGHDGVALVAVRAVVGAAGGAIGLVPEVGPHHVGGGGPAGVGQQVHALRVRGPAVPARALLADPCLRAEPGGTCDEHAIARVPRAVPGEVRRGVAVPSGPPCTTSGSTGSSWR